jgi:hypothetical protein
MGYDAQTQSRRPTKGSRPNMATRSITDPFVCRAADFYRAVADAEEKAEQRRKLPEQPIVTVRKATDEEVKKMMANK